MRYVFLSYLPWILEKGLVHLGFFLGGGAEVDGEKGTDWNGTEIP